ncbi:hypothetical protein MTO96_039393 [Rhipicephalus appendiculatus]
MSNERTESDHIDNGQGQITMATAARKNVQPPSLSIWGPTLGDCLRFLNNALRRGKQLGSDSDRHPGSFSAELRC